QTRGIKVSSSDLEFHFLSIQAGQRETANCFTEKFRALDLRGGGLFVIDELPAEDACVLVHHAGVFEVVVREAADDIRVPAVFRRPLARGGFARDGERTFLKQHGSWR